MSRPNNTFQRTLRKQPRKAVEFHVKRTLMAPAKFKVFGRIVLVEKGAYGWRAYYPGTDEKKRPADFVIPNDVDDSELAQYLGDLFHENARPSNTEVVRF